MRYLLILLVSSFAVPFTAVAKSSDSLTDLLLQNEVRIDDEVSVSSNERILVLVDLVQGAEGSGVRKDFIAQLIRSKLSNAGVQAQKYARDFQQDFAGRKLSPKELLSPKIVTEIDIDQDDPRLGYSSDCTISLIEYSEVSQGRYKPQRTWLKRQTLRGISRQDIEDNLVQYIQKELGGFISTYRATKAKEAKRAKIERARKDVGQGSGGVTSTGALSYSLRWSDPDNKRNRFLFGASAGTPALVNLHFGFWGSRGFPLVAGVSGMYFGSDRRGAQLDLGWAFDNTGSFKQVLGITAAVFNETDKVTTYEKDPFGRVTNTTVETVESLRPYVGPAYTMDWNNFRVQLGVGAKASSQAQSNFRAFFQIGYTPPLGF